MGRADPCKVYCGVQIWIQTAVNRRGEGHIALVAIREFAMFIPIDHAIACVEQEVRFCQSGQEVCGVISLLLEWRARQRPQLGYIGSANFK